MSSYINVRKGIAFLLVPLMTGTMAVGQVSLSPAQDGPPPQGPPPAQQQAPLLSPDQLDNLVAPVALYPDPLLGEVLAASTYPLEIVEVQQWLQQNPNLHGADLVNAAKQQPWDPSVQALVAFPDALNLLDHNIQWTTDLGNAFLAQQSDVMAAVQRMRARAQANGRLTSTPQQVVTTDAQNGQSAIQIQPADPQVVYVPVYQPAYVWGPPVWGAYPGLWYPPGFGFGFGFAPGIYLSAFFPGWLGWGGWGWGLGWFGGGLFVNTAFFGHYGYHGYYGGYYRGGYGYGGYGRAAWAHDPSHRMGVAYPNRTVASQFNSNRFAGSRSNGAVANTRGFNSFNRAGTNGYAGSLRQASPNGASQNYGARATPQARSFNSSPAQSFNASPYRGGAQSYNRSFAPSYSTQRSYAAPRSYSGAQSFAVPWSSSAPRSFSAPRQSFAAPRSSGGSFSGGGSHFSGGGHSGFSGGHAGGGGHSGGGGHHR